MHIKYLLSINKKLFNAILLKSDEEEEDLDALIYLPIAPDIDEPEIENPLSIPAPHTHPETPAKSRRLKTVDIDLKEAPKDGIILFKFKIHFTC